MAKSFSLSTGFHTVYPPSGETEHTGYPQGYPQGSLPDDPPPQQAGKRTPAEVSRANAALGRAVRTEIAEERFERYGQLRRGGYSIQEAAWELRISRRHADRYEARLRKERAR